MLSLVLHKATTRRVRVKLRQVTTTTGALQYSSVHLHRRGRVTHPPPPFQQAVLRHAEMGIKNSEWETQRRGINGETM